MFTVGTLLFSAKRRRLGSTKDAVDIRQMCHAETELEAELSAWIIVSGNSPIWNKLPGDMKRYISECIIQLNKCSRHTEKHPHVDCAFCGFVVCAEHRPAYCFARCEYCDIPLCQSTECARLCKKCKRVLCPHCDCEVCETY